MTHNEEALRAALDAIRSGRDIMSKTLALSKHIANDGDKSMILNNAYDCLNFLASAIGSTLGFASSEDGDVDVRELECYLSNCIA